MESVAEGNHNDLLTEVSDAIEVFFNDLDSQELADDVVAGKLKTQVEIRGSSEIMDIANVLNGVLGGVNNYKKEMDVDHHLLSLRADEGASQLSRRDCSSK